MLADYGLLLIRVILGLTMMGHGAQKLFGWFGGYGLKGTGGWLESIGIRPGVLMAFIAGAGELVGGLLFGLGLFTWIGAILIVGTMVVAIGSVHGKNGYWVTQNGYEYNLILIVIAIAVAMIGAGSISLDAIL
ncbi:DoxX family protein [Paenibacillus sp. ACRRX]|uniref:DoxX family protein n=1 Tax=unclassified Paenibacillus TaxID=185978 RepID=UPI001EF50CCF|nr:MULTISPECIES: DoxX family protein [unclassified Paenibacillus]MCG7408655.1 DoxX family protein [Paenibacillus sp. ACRRX]MDK8183418.1 DoxX family protein [Paenibacillus sp. UMB4589-SE434]